MELKIKDYKLPEKISFNFEELKCELQEKVSIYETLVYSDEQIKLAKADKANLNKLKKALNDERIRMEKEYMVPFNEFKAQINEIIGIIDKPVKLIDKQVKEYEEKKKNEKMNQINEYFCSLPKIEGFENLKFEQIENERWKNASVSMRAVQDEISGKLNNIKNDLETLSNLPEFGFEATEVYKNTLDINKAIAEGHRLSEIARKKKEYEATQAAKLAEKVAEAEIAQATNPPVEEVAATEEVVVPPAEPARQWIAFQALLSTEDALALRDFFNSRNIEFKKLL